VPEDVIRKMHQRLQSSGPVDVSYPTVEPYEPKPGAPKAILVDIDGTIAHNASGRGFYDWLAVGTDEPILEVIEIVNWAKMAGFTVIVMSGRDGISREVTADWLERHDVPVDELYMRGINDQRKDSIVKRELFDAYVRDNYDVQFVLDDRNQVVDMWRAMGLRCLQVAPGNF
jgi:histidinol phosphatase-like enzyme